MAAIHDLLQQIQDPALRARLAEEIGRLSKNKKFGLVFEEHIPECTPLYDVPVKSGRTVARNMPGKINEVYCVLNISDGVAVCCKKTDNTIEEINVDELIAVARFGDPIYPYLKPIDSVCNAPDSNLWHTLIEADNYHALQLLKYLYAGKVDCIYIDPPYNTGARDWKYNNDYVDSADNYRHSKWLSMMKKRLELARNLLNLDNSVLIITIDEKEYLHLGCLLEEMFPEARMQMVSDIINPKGTNRFNEFSRTNEYVYYLFFGNAQLIPQTTSMFEIGNDADSTESDLTLETEWLGLRRRGHRNTRSARPNQFYPIFINSQTGYIHSIGDCLKKEESKESISIPEGCYALYPLTPSGDEMIWGKRYDSARSLWKKGLIRVRNGKKPAKAIVEYLTTGIEKDIEEGKIVITGRGEQNELIGYRINKNKLLLPKATWFVPSHNADAYGSVLLKKTIGENRFTYPKSLYSVVDTLRFVVSSKPHALIVDFFAGSGTTLHAVNLLNAEDGGHRRCILVTNNEVSADEATVLKKKGFKPGDDEWEKLGIARYVTWPRTVCSIEGHDINGNPLKGSYIGSDIPMSDGFAANCEYFKLGFLDKKRVSVGMQFREILPLLWLRAGAKGKRPEIEGEDIPEMLILPENGFAVLTEEALYSVFVKELSEKEGVETVFFVTNSDSAFREMSDGIKQNDTYQLYKDYLENFMIGARRALQ